jgi:hypothetical protein
LVRVNQNRRTREVGGQYSEQQRLVVLQGPSRSVERPLLRLGQYAKRPSPASRSILQSRILPSNQSPKPLPAQASPFLVVNRLDPSFLRNHRLSSEALASVHTLTSFQTLAPTVGGGWQPPPWALASCRTDTSISRVRSPPPLKRSPLLLSSAFGDIWRRRVCRYTMLVETPQKRQDSRQRSMGRWGLRNEGASADDDGGGDSLVWGFNVGSAFQ